MPKRLVPVAPGDTINVPDHGYCFGVGPLCMRVTAAGPPFIYTDRTWWQEVHGHEVCRCGEDHDRVATVRVDTVTKIPEPRPAT